MGLSDLREELSRSLEAQGAEVDASPWDPDTGTGLAGIDRQQWKPRLVLAAVCDALAASERWWDDVGRVRGGEPSKTVAGAYGAGKRRTPIAVLLDHAASRDDRTSSALAMVNSPRAYIKPSDEAAAPTPRAFRGDFRIEVHEGALLIARRGAGRCLVCGNPLAGERRTKLQARKRVRSRVPTADGRRTTWRSKRDYCQSHDPARVDAQFPAAEAAADRARQESIRVVFEWLSRVDFREAGGRLGLEDSV